MKMLMHERALDEQAAALSIRHGLEAWPVVDAPGEAVAHVSPPPSNQGTPQVRSSRTAPVRRMTVRNVDGLTDAEVDRIKAEVESGDDDARLTRIVATYPSGQHFTLSGVREGLAGTYSQGARGQSHPARHHDEPLWQGLHRSKRQRPRFRRSPRHPPPREDTAITVTATSPDGSAQPHFRVVLKRSGK